jgi:hypothetical protein
MGTQHPDLFAALAAPFDPQELKTRSQSGKQLHYITARVAMNRLDNVLGPENWWDEYVPSENSVLCRLTIRLPDGSTLTKCDAGGYAGMSDSGDDDKSGYSDAFKRTCVKFGVARYLYRDGVPDFVRERVGTAPDARDVAPVPDPRREINDSFRPSQPAPSRQPADGQAQQYDDRPPTTGKQLFAWIMKRDNANPGLKLLASVNQWAKQNELGGKMVDWPEEEIPGALAAARYFIDQAAKQEGYEEALSN